MSEKETIEKIQLGVTKFTDLNQTKELAEKINESFKPEKFCPMIHATCKGNECIAWIRANVLIHTDNTEDEKVFYTIGGNTCGSPMINKR